MICSGQGTGITFLKLARLNVKLISEMGIEELVTACPECYRAFSHDYPENGIRNGIQSYAHLRTG